MSETLITDKDALTLAKGFRAASTAVGDYLYDNWATIAAQDRGRLQTMEISLLNIASDMTTQAVGIIIDDSKTSLAELNAASADAKAVLNRLDDVATAFVIVTALIGLASAIPAGNVGVLVSAGKKLREALTPKQADAPQVEDPQVEAAQGAAAQGDAAQGEATRTVTLKK